MQDVPLMIVVFGAMVLIIDHIRRLFAAISLNRTIREAIRHHPDSVAPLLDRLETRAPIPLALGGWVFLALGLIAGVMIALEGDAGDRENVLAAGIVAGLGLALLVANWWLCRAAPPADQAEATASRP